MNPRIKANIKRPGMLVNMFLRRFFSDWMSDETWLKLCFKYKMGYKLNLKNPQTFSEKLQWLKLYDRRPEYTKMVDKAAVKDYVAGIIGDDYIIPTLGIWDKAEDIEWEKLPDQFVLKCNHDSGSICICRDKSTFNREAAIKKLSHALTVDYYKKTSKEWPYKNVIPKILAEQYISPEPNKEDLTDYKWFCFNGEPKFCQVIQDRTTKETIDFFDTDWIHQDFIGLTPTAVHAETLPEKPRDLETQLQIAKKLSEGIPFSRIDLFEIGEKEYFGEITFFPKGGLGSFNPEEYNRILGEMLVLPGEKWAGGVIINKLQSSELQISQPDLLDYKFFCFNGEPRLCQVIGGRNSKEVIDFFDKDWKHQPFHEPKHFPFADVEPSKPKCYNHMWDLARLLAKDKAFVRVDFYEIKGKVYFGEITFFPTGGYGGFDPQEWDYKFGGWITLPDAIK